MGQYTGNIIHELVKDGDVLVRRESDIFRFRLWLGKF